MATSGNVGPLGQPRGILFGILITIVTLGLYAIWWTFKTHEEVKQHSGQGVGGWLGIVIYFVIGVVTPFLLPYEIDKMHQQDARPSPVSAWTGLWMIPGFLLLFIGPIVWFVKVQGGVNRYWESKGATV